ncbi:MAG: hypothetical protein SGBAC_005543 [Bacillariaceae sp.]
MNRSIGYEAFPPASSPGAEDRQAEVEHIYRSIGSKLAPGGMPLQTHLGSAKTYPIRSALLSTTPAVVHPHLLTYAGGKNLQLLSPRFGFVEPGALGLVPSVTPVAANIQTLHDYYWRRRFLSAQSIFDHGKPSNVPVQKKEPVKAAVTTESAAISSIVYSDCDKNVLSEYQCLVRQQLEFFESSNEDTRWSSQGRIKDIALAQVGIRCKWCSHLPTQCRSPGAVYYSATVDGLYQAAQNTVKNHLCKECRHIPPDIEKRLHRLRDGKRRGPAGKKYWAERARARGIYECGGRLRLKQSKLAITSSKKATA